MNAALDLDEKIGAAAARHRGLADLFEELGLDYACEGDLTIGEALRGMGLFARDTLARLERAASRPGGEDWNDLPLADVIDFVERENQDILRGRLSAIVLRLDEACSRADNAGLAGFRRAFGSFSEELVIHIEREQLVVFPAIVALEEAWEKRIAPPPRFEGGMRPVTSRLVLEHFGMARELRALREARAAVPELDQPRFTPIVRRLDSLGRHINRCINLENHVIFPRAVALEDAMHDNPKEAAS